MESSRFINKLHYDDSLDIKRVFFSNLAAGHDIFFTDLTHDDQEWMTILNHAEESMQGASRPDKTIFDGDTTHKGASKLVPWTLSRIQIAVTPKIRRFPMDISFHARRSGRAHK